MNSNTQKEKRFYRAGGECLYRWSHTGVYYFKGQINGKEYNLSLHTTDRAEAKRKLVALRHEKGYIDPAAAHTATIATLCDLYRPRFAHLKPHTREIKNNILERIENEWPTGPDTLVSKIQSSDCDRWLAKYPLGASRYNDHVWLLKDLFALAVRDKLRTDSPAKDLKIRRREDPERLTPSFEEFKAIIASVRGQKFNGHDAEASGDFLEFMGLAGLGQAETSELTCGHVDWKANQISILRHKTRKRFRIPIYPQLRPVLEKLCAGKEHDEKLFKIQDAKKALAAACKRLRFPKFSQRSFRRMFITRAIERGIDVKVIAEWQGHRDGGVLILRTYSHVRPVHSQRMAALMTSEEPENVVRMPTKEGAA